MKQGDLFGHEPPPDDDERKELVELGEHRTEIHKNQVSQRILGEGHDERGLFGQDAFSRLFGIPIDKSDKLQGDGHDNFTLITTKGKFSVKVATVHFRNVDAHGLLIESKTLKPNRIYIQAVYMERYPWSDKGHEPIREAWLNGWAWGKTLLEEGGPSRMWPLTVWNHRLETSRLRSMDELLAIQVR